MRTFEQIMRDGGVFYMLEYDGSEIKTLPYSMIWCGKDIEVINFIENLLKHHNFSFYVKNKINEDLSKRK